MRVLVAGLILAVPAVGLARPITAGVSVGAAQSKEDSANTSANTTLGLFGRLGLSSRLAAQLELQRFQTDQTGTAIRSATGLLVVDLTAGSRLVPILVAGAGFDWDTNSYGGEIDAHHFEGGLGLEYRASAGLTLGADVRIGGRSIDSNSVTTPILYNGNGGGGVAAAYAPSDLREGEYRTARVTVGVRF